jgi:nitronate monooxygenase
MKFPKIIQGGMGAGVSDWRLARAVATAGQLGVVSGTALDLILTRRLQEGDPQGHVRRALAAFPEPGIVGRILDRWFVEDGKDEAVPYAGKPLVGEAPGARLEELLVVANFVEVWLAKEGHPGMVGINYLHKIQTPTLPSLFGAMLAGVNVVLVGAGIPLEIPSILDGLAAGEPVEMALQVTGATREHKLRFDPARMFPSGAPPLKRPAFFPIVSSVALATILVRKAGGGVDGLVIEDPTAGGHNAPPRGALKLDDHGEPVYGPRDAVDPAAIAALGLPFWLAGSNGSPEKLREAPGVGAAGVQVGTVFAFCEESGLREDLKQAAIQAVISGDEKVFRDPVASPTGFPFQVLALPETLSKEEVYQCRERQCDLGYLREGYEREDGTVGWRCPAEDPATFVEAGGTLEQTEGRKCLCNSLMANLGLGQWREGKVEPPLLTCGKDLSGVRRILAPGRTSYTAREVLEFLLGEPVPDLA